MCVIFARFKPVGLSPKPLDYIYYWYLVRDFFVIIDPIGGGLAATPEKKMLVQSL